MNYGHPQPWNQKETDGQGELKKYLTTNTRKIVLGRYSDRVELIFDIMNMTDKVIKGVQGNLTICDLFGIKILTINCDFTGNSIPSNNSITVDDLGMDINRFMDDHVKIYNTHFEDLIFEYKVTSIVYSDGTTEWKQEMKRDYGKTL